MNDIFHIYSAITLFKGFLWIMTNPEQ